MNKKLADVKLYIYKFEMLEQIANKYFFCQKVLTIQKQYIILKTTIDFLKIKEWGMNMKFTVINDKSHEFDLKISFSKDEKRDRLGCMCDVALGCSRVILEMVRDCNSKENAKTLTKFLIEKITESVEACIEEHYNEKDNSILGCSLYSFMAPAFDEWLEGLNNQGISDEEDFIKVCKDKQATLKYLIDQTEVKIFLLLNDGKALDIFGFPISLLDENEDRFDSYCIASEAIATIAFDKMYGENNNPLRNAEFVLMNEIKNEIKRTKKE